MDGHRDQGIKERKGRWERREEGGYFYIKMIFASWCTLVTKDTHTALPCSYISTDRKYRTIKKIPGKKKIVPISISPFMTYVARI